MKKKLGFRIKVSQSEMVHGCSYDRKYQGFVPFSPEKEGTNEDHIGEEVGSAIGGIGLPRPFCVLATAVVQLCGSDHDDEDKAPLANFISAAHKLLEHWEKHDAFLRDNPKATVEQILDQARGG